MQRKIQLSDPVGRMVLHRQARDLFDAGTSYQDILDSFVAVFRPDLLEPFSGHFAEFRLNLLSHAAGRLNDQNTTAAQNRKRHFNLRGVLNKLARKRSSRDGLTIAQLLELWKRQEGRCALSGMPMTLNAKGNANEPRNPSLDRIKPGGPYEIGNVRLVCDVLNKWRSTTPDEEFIEMCRAVAKHNPKGRNASVAAVMPTSSTAKL